MIIALLGLPRTGKTAMCTFFLRLFSLMGLPVYANYKLTGIENSHYVYASELLTLNCCALGLDEAYALYESRNSNSRVARFDSLLPFQSGKRGVIVVYTAQLDGSVDKRLRELADYRFAVLKDEERECFIYAPVTVDGDVLEDEAFEIPFEFMREFVFGHYDTFEPVLPIGFRELALEVARFSPEKMLPILDEQIELVFSHRSEFLLEAVKDVNVKAVEYALMRLNQPVSYAALVCQGLKIKLNELRLCK